MRYVGCDPPEEVTPKESLKAGEEKEGWGRWKVDMYGVGEVLARKRVARGWKGQLDIEEYVEREVGGLLEWKGGVSGVEVYGGPLPWDGGGGANEEC